MLGQLVGSIMKSGLEYSWMNLWAKITVMSKDISISIVKTIMEYS